MKIKLSKPIMINGTELKEINLDFDKLTGNDIINASREAQLLGENIVLAKYFQSQSLCKIFCSSRPWQKGR